MGGFLAFKAIKNEELDVLTSVLTCLLCIASISIGYFVVRFSITFDSCCLHRRAISNIMPRLEGPEDSYRKISKKALFRKVEQVVSDEVTNSMSINDTGALDMIPRFEKNEVISGRVVGRGGFCVVEEVTSLDVAPSDDESPRERMARLARTQNSGKYVIKQVTPGLFGSDKVTYLRGTIDLALEAHYLTSMNDKHIINLRGVAKIAPWEDLGYFLILDRLQETLSKRLNAWMHRKRSMGGISGIFCGSDRKKTSLLTERLAAAHDVAKAMDYLHSRNIIYRDLVRISVSILIQA